jgi:hypothetical protein
MSISTAIFLYTLSIIAGVVLVVYGLSVRPRKREQLVDFHDHDVSTDSSVPIDAGHTLQPNDDSSEEQEALDRNPIK